MESIITDYLMTEKQIESEIVRTKILAKILKYDDIANEFVQWLKDREYSESGIQVMGYKARDIYDMAPFLDGIGVYNFLVTLRDNPERGQEIIKSGFVRK